jgi:hypothetical protein
MASDSIFDACFVLYGIFIPVESYTGILSQPTFCSIPSRIQGRWWTLASQRSVLCHCSTLSLIQLLKEFPFKEEKDTGCLHTAPMRNAIHGDLKDVPKWNNAKRKSIKISREKSEFLPETIGWPTDDAR